MALFAVFALAAAVSATSAMALELPDVHVLSGETYPATGTGKIEEKEVGSLETELGEKLTSGTIATSVELTELSSLGPGSLTFTQVVETKSKTACNTVGDPSGTVKFSGEYHIVDTSTSPLTPAVLVLFKELVVECNSGKTKVKIRSPIVIKLTKVGGAALVSGEDVTEYAVNSKCSGKGKQELKEYLNDEGVGTKAVLTANFGLGFETACQNSTKELPVKSSKMVDFLF
jgi:hypothetical protein